MKPSHSLLILSAMFVAPHVPPVAGIALSAWLLLVGLYTAGKGE